MGEVPFVDVREDKRRTTLPRIPCTDNLDLTYAFEPLQTPLGKEFPEVSVADGQHHQPTSISKIKSSISALYSNNMDDLYTCVLYRSRHLVENSAHLK